MSELTLTAVRLGLLVLLWLFVFSIVGVLRGDLYGTRIVQRGRGGRATIRPTPNAPIQRPQRGRRGGPTSLVVVEGSMKGTTVPLKESGVLLGRNPECTLVLDDEFASGRHARVYATGDGWQVEDLASTNGSFLDGQRLDRPRPLAEGTPLRIGTTVLELRR
ncbi:MAG TPA: FHA domain-containing protein [Dermatophilaceae bacterium]|nr:FHA domain-containing protein [Dermatophilaceae bacterium]